MSNVPASEALGRLVEGNRRFRDDPMAEGWAFQGPRLLELAEGQRPFAAVLGCSDSRVPVEVVFGQGPGQLFVVRVAGNVVAPTQLGSLEFAVRELGVRLIMVLGHQGCGAVSATLAGRGGPKPDYLRALTRRIRDGIRPVLEDHSGSEVDRLERAVRMNVQSSRMLLLRRSKELARLYHAGDLWIAGAVYELSSGTVELLERGDRGGGVVPGGERSELFGPALAPGRQTDGGGQR